ncbi:MAG: TonB-dependent receptor [candidate division WOR-3 bacterium]
MKYCCLLITYTITVFRFAIAEEYGSIAGKVVDAESGEPLISAEVFIMGGEIGAAADEQGNYLILNVPPGEYNVTASHIGYNPVTIYNVLVVPDQTTFLNFKLKSPPIGDIHPLLLCYPRMIYVNQSLNAVIKRAKEVRRLPIISFDDFLRIQQGVAETNSGFHIRGGKVYETEYYLDGILIGAPNTGRLPIQINKEIIDEVSIINGGLYAENGDAPAVINIATKTGNSSRHSGNISWLSDGILQNKRLDYGYNEYKFLINGPLPLRRLRYLLSGEWLSTDAYQPAKYRIYSPGNDYRLFGKLSYYLPNARGKFDISGLRVREQFVYYIPYEENAVAFKYLENKPMMRSKYQILAGSFSYMLSWQTIASVGIGFTHFDRVFGPRDYEWELKNNYKRYDDYRLKFEELLDLLNTKEYKAHYASPREVLIEGIRLGCRNSGPDVLRKSPYGVDEIFYTIGDYPVWRYWYNNDLQMHAKIECACGKYHDFKAGIDFIKYDIRYYNRTFPPLTEDYPDFNFYERTPYRISGFLQDKIDITILITNLGIRFDYFDPQVWTFKDLYNLGDDTLTYADKITTLSPRLGFSLPITEWQKFRFSYSHYNVIPNFDYLYNTSDTAVIRLIMLRYRSNLSNISLKPEKTVAYEFGFENMLSRFLLFTFSIFYKDIFNAVELRKVIALPEPYYQYFNDGRYYVKGLEIALIRAFADAWGFNLNYTLQLAEGTGAWAHQLYYESDVIPPAVDYPLDYDERHSIRANIDFQVPGSFSIKFLRDITNSVIFCYHSGHPYTPLDFSGDRAGNVNSSRMPGYWNVDWKLSKKLRVKNFSLVFTGLINNLFNTKQISEVYPTTGNPDDPGLPEPTLGAFDFIPITGTHYSPQADYNHDGLITPSEMKSEYISALNDLYSDPTFYKNPFRIRLGVGIEF